MRENLMTWFRKYTIQDRTMLRQCFKIAKEVANIHFNKVFC